MKPLDIFAHLLTLSNKIYHDSQDHTFYFYPEDTSITVRVKTPEINAVKIEFDYGSKHEETGKPKKHVFHIRDFNTFKPFANEMIRSIQLEKCYEFDMFQNYIDIVKKILANEYDPNLVKHHNRDISVDAYSKTWTVSFIKEGGNIHNPSDFRIGEAIRDSKITGPMDFLSISVTIEDNDLKAKGKWFEMIIPAYDFHKYPMITERMNNYLSLSEDTDVWSLLEKEAPQRLLDKLHYFKLDDMLDKKDDTIKKQKI